jgi:glutathione synthase/RimK-type ligase-like ATP-grasp enzyme
MSYFAYHARSKPTGEALAAVLGLTHGINPSDHSYESGNVLIRWGNRRHPSCEGDFSKTINPAHSINICSNKLESLERMLHWGENDPNFNEDKAINVPAFSTDPMQLIEEIGYPILGRKLRHARGTDIELILQERDLRKSQSDYFIAYIPTDREFRVHVVGDKVIRVQGKYLDFPEQKNPWIRNYSTGYRFRKPRMRLRSDRLKMAVSSVKSLGLDFGAVDLLIADDRSCYVLEVNTAPSCSPLTLGAYAVALHELAGLETEIDLGLLDMLDPTLEEMDSEDEVEDD